jgi:hypothetical protein
VPTVEFGVDVFGSTNAADSLTRHNLSSESRKKCWIISEVRTDQLESDTATLRTLSEINDTHPACAYSTKQTIRTQELWVFGLELFQRVVLREAGSLSTGSLPGGE